MIETILGIFTSGGFGAITGLVGSFMAKREERKVLELKYAYEKDMAEIDRLREEADRDHDLAMADKQVERAEAEGAIAMDVAEVGLVDAAIQAQAKSSGNKTVDAVLRFVRPAITAYLLVVVTLIGFKLHELTGGLNNLPIAEVFDLYKHIVHQTVFLAVTAVAWWFGSRGVKREQ